MAKIQDYAKRGAILRPPGRIQLRAWLALEDITQEELAARIGTSRTNLSRVMRGQRASRPVLEAIERETGIAPARFEE